MSYDDGPELIGLGRAGRVMRFGNTAVKTANIWTMPEDTSETTIVCREQMNEANIESLKHEGLVYHHIGNLQGVIKPCQISNTEIQMPYLRQGSLSSYLRTHSDSVDSIQQLQWLREAAHIIRRVHERRVLIADIATRISCSMRIFRSKCAISPSLSLFQMMRTLPTLYLKTSFQSSSTLHALAQ